MTPEQINQIPPMPADESERQHAQWNLLHMIKDATEEQMKINVVQDTKITRINSRSITAIVVAAVAIIGIAYYVSGIPGGLIAGGTQTLALIAMRTLKII